MMTIDSPSRPLARFEATNILPDSPVGDLPVSFATASEIEMRQLEINKCSLILGKSSKPEKNSHDQTEIPF